MESGTYAKLKGLVISYNRFIQRFVRSRKMGRAKYTDFFEQEDWDKLDEEELNKRMPQNPADLVDALQDPIHREVGRSRAAKTSRSRKKKIVGGHKKNS